MVDLSSQSDEYCPSLLTPRRSTKLSVFFLIYVARSSNYKVVKHCIKMPLGLRNLFQSRDSRSQLPLSTPPSSIPRLSRGHSSQDVAPQDLAVQPSQATVGPALTAANTQASLASIGEGQNYGVKVLYDGGIVASVDIVFVHGLTGNAYNTWLHKDARVHWPSELLRQDIPDARILSFGYDADIVNFWNPVSNSRLSNHAESLVGDLVRRRERTNTETRKILFVAHSLGGLVIEYALSHSRNTAEKFLHQVERCTAGIIFLGVPHYGADLVSWAKFGTRMVGVLRQANKDIVGVLDPGSEMLREVQKGFHIILRLRKDEGSEISITCFFEELPVITVGEV